MPLNVDDFLTKLPDLVALRRSAAYAAPESRERQRLLKQIYEREQEARLHWEAGTEGWLTDDEAIVIVEELLATAARLARVARVEVRNGYLVFSGGDRGGHRLALASTGPARARAHWAGYLDACPSSAPTPALGPEPPAKQLDLGLLGGPPRRRPRERSRMLSIPLPRRFG